MRVKTLATFAAALTLLVGTVAFAQQGPVEAKIPFAFTAGKMTMPAGQYSFVPNSESWAVTVTSADRKLGVVVPVSTRLAGGIHTTRDDAHIVFDKIGDTYILSEVWRPDEDGFQLSVTKEKHEHNIVNVPRATK